MIDLNPLGYTNPLIGLIGKKRSGKDTVASTMTEEFGYTRYAFADPMKSALLRLNPWVTSTTLGDNSATFTQIRLAAYVEMVGWEAAKEAPEVRRLLQEFGQSIRDIYPEFWILATMVPVDGQREETPVVVSDVRMRNEAETIRGVGGVLIRIDRPGLTSDDSHISENDLNDFEPDFIIVNDGSLTDLAEKVRQIMK